MPAISQTGRSSLLTKPPSVLAQLQGKMLAEVLTRDEPTETLKRIHGAATNWGHLQLSLRATRTSKEEHFQMSARWDSHCPELACSRRSFRVWRYWGATRACTERTPAAGEANCVGGMARTTQQHADAARRKSVVPAREMSQTREPCGFKAQPGLRGSE